MEFLIDIQQNHDNPEGLEALYQFSRKEKTEQAFKDALLACYQETPNNLLYAAWYHRLNQPEEETERTERGINWRLAIPLAILNGLIFWYFSSDEFQILEQIPTLALFAAPITGIAILAYLAMGAKWKPIPALGVGLALLAFPLYAGWIGPTLQTSLQESYLTMAVPHIALLAWIGVGWSIVSSPGWGGSATARPADERARPADEKSRLAFILKSFEVLVTAGLFAIAGGIFSGVAVGMFDALGVDIPDLIQRLIFAGGAGVIPVIAVATVYDPLREPTAQTFGQGVSRLMPTLVRLLLPATLLVLLIYIALIPFNFRAPIENREVLIINNVMLFAIMGLLMGATPLQEEDIPQKSRLWIRRGIIAVAALAVLISLHALTAILFRTFTGSLTLNRTIVIGWNLANLSILITLLVHQFRRGTSWVTGLHKTFSLGTVIYLGWALLVVVAIPIFY